MSLNHRITQVVLLLFFSVSYLGAQSSTSPLLVEARKTMPKAFEDEKTCQELYNSLKIVKNPEPLLKGYVGAVNIAMSKHSPLLDKRNYLKTGTGLLESAIKEKPNTLELLFLRMTIQINLPSFLGYDDNIESDKKFVLENYSSAPDPLRQRIINFINKSDYFSSEEKARVN